MSGCGVIEAMSGSQSKFSMPDSDTFHKNTNNGIERSENEYLVEYRQQGSKRTAAYLKQDHTYTASDYYSVKKNSGQSDPEYLFFELQDKFNGSE